MFRVDAKTPAVRRSSVQGFRNTAAIWSIVKWNSIKRGNANTDQQARCYCTNCLHYLSQKPRAVFKAASVVSRSRVRAQKLMAQVTVTVLDINEIESGVLSDNRGLAKAVDNLSDF